MGREKVVVGRGVAGEGDHEGKNRGGEQGERREGEREGEPPI